MPQLECNCDQCTEQREAIAYRKKSVTKTYENSNNYYEMAPPISTIATDDFSNIKEYMPYKGGRKYFRGNLKRKKKQVPRKISRFSSSIENFAAEKTTIIGTPAVIRWYNRRFGYGFVSVGSSDIFFHHNTVVLEGFSKKTKLKRGLEVLVRYRNVIHKKRTTYVCTKVVVK